MSTVKKELLRDDRNGKIAGVCAGLADYFGWELWLVRVVALASVLLGFGSFRAGKMPLDFRGNI